MWFGFLRQYRLARPPLIRYQRGTEICQVVLFRLKLSTVYRDSVSRT